MNQFPDNTHNHYEDNGTSRDLVIPDYSRVTQQFQEKRFRKRAQFWFQDNGEMPLEVIDQGVFRFDRAHPRYVTESMLVGCFIQPNGVELISMGVQYEKAARIAADKALKEAERAVQEKTFDSLDVFCLLDRTSDYAGLFFNNVYPEDFLREQVGLCFDGSDEQGVQAEQAVKTILMPTTKSNFHYEIHLRLVKEAEALYRGHEPDIADIMARYGFYENHDLRPGRLENEGLIRANIDSLVADGKTDYDQERARIYGAVLATRIAKENILRELFDRADSSSSVDSALIQALCNYADGMLEYDDFNRRIRTRTYKVFRDLIQHFELDIQSTSVEELDARIKSEGR